MVRYEINEEQNGVEIYFDRVPSEDIRNLIKSEGFRWNGRKKCWYATKNDHRIDIAKKVANGDSIYIPETSSINVSEEIMSKRCCYAAKLSKFLTEDIDSWMDQMKSAFSESYLLSLGQSQIHAWKDCFYVLQRELMIIDKMHPGFHIVFEYELPYESGRRPDVLLVSNECVIILEFKMKGVIEKADVDQVSAYARDIKEYHYESRNKKIIPVLVLTRKSEYEIKFMGLIPCCEDTSLAKTIGIFANSLPSISQTNIDKWLESKYEPLPTIVEAARLFMKNEELPNIRRVNSTGIPQAMDFLKKITREAQANKEHTIVFVTGVPGSGKTFLGLQYVYDISEENKNVNSVYLSGNGPLVKVMTDALNSNVFVKAIHTVENEFLRHGAKDFNNNVIVFDEGQRAWDVHQMSEKGRGHQSEPEVMISLAEARLEWCVLLILVGEGQEIYKGENAGLGQWADAVENGKNEWNIVCPSKIADEHFKDYNPLVDDSLDLTVSLRTHLAGDVSKFANSFIDGKISEAEKYVSSIYSEGFSMFVTRDLDKAKDYCRKRYAGQLSKRYGMIASSKTKGGVRPTFRPDVAKWFNANPNEYGSSCALNVTISEFDCQGLELDMPIICWGADMTWNGLAWNLYNKTQEPNSDENTYRTNSYRVLLTRGRDGFIVYIPMISSLDEVYSLFIDIGIMEL